MFGTKTMINLNEAKEILDYYIKSYGGETPVLFEAYLPQHFHLTPREFERIINRIDPNAEVFDYVAVKIEREVKNGEKAPA